MDKLLLLILVDFVSEIIDIHVNHIGESVKIDVPDVFGNHGAGDDRSGISHEKLQKRILLGG